MKLHDLNHSGFCLHTEGDQLMGAPFIPRNPLAVGRLRDVAASYVLLSHGQGNHVRDVPARHDHTDTECFILSPGQPIEL